MKRTNGTHRNGAARDGLGQNPVARGLSSNPDTLVLSGRALTRQSVVYALGSTIVLPIGLISVAVTTRYLGTSQYGHLTALMATAVLVGVLGQVGCLQGTLLSVYGVGGGGDGDDLGEDAGDDVVAEEEIVAQAASEGRRLLGTGMLLTLGQNALLAIVGVLIAGPADDLLVHSHNPTAVRLAMVAGASGAMWTFIAQLYRLERRPGAHVAMNVIRPIFVIAFTVAALVSGGGVDGVMIATVAANVASALLGLAFTFRHYIFRPSMSDVRLIYKKGARMAPIPMIAYLRTNLDVLLLNQAVSAHVVGLYGVASKIAQIPMYFSSAFLMAWAPMERSPIFRASRARVGRARFAGVLFTHFVVVNLGILVTLSLVADALIHLLAPGYAGAAPLVPWVAASTVAGSTFYGMYRATFFAKRRIAYEVLGTSAAAAFAGIGLTLLRPIGTYAIPWTGILVGLLATIGMDLWDRAAGKSLALEYRRIAVAVGLTVLVVSGARLVSKYGGVPKLWADATALVLFPMLLVGTGVIPKDRIRRLAQIVYGLRPPVIDGRRLLVRWGVLNQPERDALSATVVRTGRPVSEIAHSAGVPEAVIYARITRAIRHLNGSSTVRPIDDRIGAYLLTHDPRFERDYQAIQLSYMGASLEELYALEDSYKALRASARLHLLSPVWRRRLSPQHASASAAGR